MPALKFPSGTLLLHLAVFYFPAWRNALLFSTSIAEQIKDLAFSMKRNFPPSLFIAANGLHWYSKKLGQLFLGLLQLLSTFMKFFRIHKGLPNINATYHNAVLHIAAFCKVRRHIFWSMTVMILAVYISPVGHNGLIGWIFLRYWISCPSFDCQQNLN